MFSSKFLSGANPLNAMSSAVNKFNLFGDDGEGDKKSPPQQGRKASGEPQPGPGPGKSTQQEQAPQKSNQGPLMQKSQPLPKQGSPQLCGKGQTAPPTNKPAGQQTKDPPQHGIQHQVPAKDGAQPVSSKQVPPKLKEQQDPAKSSVQNQELLKAGVQGPTNTGSEIVSQQQQSSPKTRQQLHSPKVGQQQKGGKNQISDRQKDIKNPGTPEVTPVGSPSLGATKARPQSKAVSKPLCPVCNTTELNIHTKESPNYKTCTQCKTEVCSLCGFSPPDTDGHEWLCLNCQIQRAQGTSEPPGPPKKRPSAPQNQKPPPGEPTKKDILAPGSSPKVQSKPIKVPASDEPPKGPENPKQGASLGQAQRMTPDTQRASGSPKMHPSGQPGQMQSRVTPAPQQVSGGLFGFSSGAKSESAKPDESVSGKMFGFGSSLFSSASTLIGSAVPDEPKITPPVSPKMQLTKDSKAASGQKLELEKKQQQPQEKKTQSAVQKAGKSPAEAPKAATASLNPIDKGQSICPICKMVLNVGSKDPPNYNSCTECKITVCNQCGFNPMPNVKEEKEWLCLNCQVKRAAAGSEPQKETLLADSFKKTTATSPGPERTSAPGSPQKKESTVPVKQVKTEGPVSQRQAGQAPGQKTPQLSQRIDPQKQTNQTIKSPQKTGNATTKESGGLFGFVAPKSQSDAAKPAESVTGKMFGFGTSIFSSASTLITSAVQDDPKTTAPVSPKLSPAKDPKSLTVKKEQQEKKPQQVPQTASPTPVQPEADKPPSELLEKESASPLISRISDSTCPLCKVILNVGTKDPPNYSTCTECKIVVCNQCGFNPTPNVKEIKEWLCLNCQVQRALGASEPPGTPVMKLRASPNKTPASADAIRKETSLQEKEISVSDNSKETMLLGSPQHKSQKSVEQSAKAEVKKGPELRKQVIPEANQKILEQDQKTSCNKPSDQTSQTEQKKSGITSTKEENGRSLKSGGSKPQPEAAKPTESLGGKMFGFGSSMLSSASNFITTAVQDESKTPPVSPKLPAAKGTKSIPVQKYDSEKKSEQVQQTSHSPLLQAKVNKDAISSDTQETDHSTCPLCKTELNIASKDSPNYKKCTECKTTVCNQCGFNPMPNVSEVKEWLCLNCQMQRALSASDGTGPPIKSETETNKGSTLNVRQKIPLPKQEESLKKELSDKKIVAPLPDSSKNERSSTPASPQRTQRAVVPPTAKEPEEPKIQLCPSTGQSHPTVERVTSTQRQTGQESQCDPKYMKVKPDAQEESEKTIGSKDTKKLSEASKTTESLGGKMFGFGSSIFSSASNLISAAESRTTPPGSRKMSAPPQLPGKMSVSPKISPKSTPTVSPKMSPAREPKVLSAKPGESQPKKEDKALSQPHLGTVSLSCSDGGPTICPLCKCEMNIGSKQTPNYNTCTECKTTVCNQCGFNPMPMGEVKEWLCLTCQVKRAVGPSEPPGPPALKSQISPSNFPPPTDVQLKDTSKLTSSPKKDGFDVVEQSREPSGKVSPQRKQSMPLNKPPSSDAPLKQVSPALDQKTPQEKLKAEEKKPSDLTNQHERRQSSTTPAKQQESGGSFGFVESKPQPEGAKTAESVGGKMLGFSSSIFSSASTLITSAVKDQLNTTPPVSPKMSPSKAAKSPTAPKVEQEKKSEQQQQSEDKPTAEPKSNEIKPSASQKLEQQKKAETSLQTKTLPSVQAKVEKTPSEVLKSEAGTHASVKLEQSTCPLCKIKLNIGSNDPPNYDTCTQCKSTVCNQCGFHPMPSKTVVEWLCLTCQMKRALEVTEPPGVTSLKPQAKSQADITSPAEPEKKVSSAPQSPQRKLSSPAQPPETADKQVDNKQPSPVPSKKTLQEQQRTSDPSKSPGQTRQTEQKQSNVTGVSQKDSGSFFGLGKGKTEPNVDKPVESVSGKMLGFGSSIFSSASTLITSAVQDQSKTTPPVSPKLSPAKEVKSNAAQKKEQPEPQQPKAPALVQVKDDKAQPEASKIIEASKGVIKPNTSCVLCKAELNMGSKEPPNYNTCTECKNTVCNQCGFDPMPNQLEMKEWLCLTCQMQRALAAADSVQPPLKKVQGSPSQVSSPGTVKKDVTNERKHSISKEEAEVTDKAQCAPQKKDILQTSASLVSKDETASASGLAKDEKTNLLSTEGTLKSLVPQSEEVGPVVSDVKQPMPTQGPPIATDKKTTPLPQDTFGNEEKCETINTSAGQLFKSIEDVKQYQAKEPQRKGSVVEVKEDDEQKTHVKKIPDKPQEPKVTPTGQKEDGKGQMELTKQDQVACPLCKVELNIDSKSPPNFNTCTDCKTTVCNKCGFSPMPNISKAREWLCLNCQMQRALGASEPPGLPMMKTQPSPSKDVPAHKQKKETPSANISKQEISEPVTDPANIIMTRETELLPVIQPTKEVSCASASVPDESGPSTATNVDVLPASQKPCSHVPKVQPDTPQQQTQKVPSSTKPAIPTNKAERGPPTDKPTSTPQQTGAKQPTIHPKKPESSPSKSASPSVQATKPESGSFFGFGGPKTQPSTEKPADSVTGKMFGFGSSFLSSASNLITSAVQDEPKTTPPTPRKMSTTDRVSPKPTPPASPKTLPTRDAKITSVQKTEDKNSEKPQQTKILTTEPAKVTKSPSDNSKVPLNGQQASKTDLSVCPLCKIKLNFDSKDLKNYNTCTECKTTVCNQCGFDAISNISETKEWLCLNCQMQRALKVSESTVAPVEKQTPSEISRSSPVIKKETVTPIKHIQKDAMEAATPLPTAAPPQQDSVKKMPVVSGSDQQKPNEMLQQMKITQSTKPEVKPDVGKQDIGKVQQQPAKLPTQPTKMAPPVQPTKQDSGGFFGFGAPKAPVAAAKSTESVTGKMFGFGSSFLSSASTLIQSAVQDEPKTTPPTPRKMSTTANTSPKVTPPVSPRIPPAKDTKISATQKSEPLQQDKPTPPPQQDKPTPPTLQDKPVLPSQQDKPIPPPQQAKPTSPLSQTKHTPPPLQDKPAPPPQQDKSMPPLSQTKPTPPPQQDKPTPPPLQDKPAPPSQKDKPTPPLSQTKPTSPPLQEKPASQPQQEKSTPPPLQDKPTPPPQQDKPTPPPQKDKPAPPPQKDKPAPPLQKDKPAPPPQQDKPMPPLSQTKPTSPPLQEKPASQPQQEKSTPPPLQDKPTPPPQQDKPTPPPQKDKSAPPPQKDKPAPPPQQDKPTPPLSQTKPTSPPLQEKPASQPQQEKSTPPPLQDKPTPPLQKDKPAPPPQQDKPTASFLQDQPTPSPPQTRPTPSLLSTEVNKVLPTPSVSTCLLCKAELNVGSTDSPNYNTCTECKNTVCNFCGFNPMPHTAKKEWLCLSCQTQRALSGQLGDSEQMSQPTYVPAKPEIQATSTSDMAASKTSPIKIELTTEVTAPKTAPTEGVQIISATTPKEEPAKIKNIAPVPSIEKEKEKKQLVTMIDVSSVASDKQSFEESIQEPVVAKPDVSSTTTSDMETVKEVTMFEVVPEKKAKPELPVSGSIITEVQTNDHINLMDKTSLQEKLQPYLQEQEKGVESGQIIAADSKELDDKIEKITDISTQVSQPLLTARPASVETNEESAEKRRDLPQTEQAANTVSFGKEEYDDDQPQILPVLQEQPETRIYDIAKSDSSIDHSLPEKEEVKPERRRLSFQAMESSEGEVTPSSSPKIGRRILKVGTVSSSSEDKTEGADSSIEDDEFIRNQILGMGDEKDMSISEDEKESNLENTEAFQSNTLDNASIKAKSVFNKSEPDINTQTELPIKNNAAISQNIPESFPKTNFKKAIPVLRQRQSTDEEIESLTESLSKGSSSIQASSVTPGSSPTSVSSLEEDSDSSPSQKKGSEQRHHRKSRQRYPTQPLPTIENSSDEEKTKTRDKPLSSPSDMSSTEDLRQVTVINEGHKTFGSEYSASKESEPEIKRAVQRGRKPSPTVIPYTPSDQFEEKDTAAKSLKSAEEAYEEIIQKTKAIPGESPPDIEPLYGGLAIEDYLYESLVEEAEIKISETQEEPEFDTASQSLKKLRSPEEVYEEMMQKKRELMMIEQEFQQAWTAMDSSSLEALVHELPAEAETCVVTISAEDGIPTEDTQITEKKYMPPSDIDTLSELPVKRKKRPAPPRPSEPPRRTEVTVVASTPTGSITFVRPMIPQDPALRKALFPIPDLKITQCSSGEEEDDSLADEYAIGISSDITPSDDSDTKEDQSISPSLSETNDMEPICVICEIPEPKPIPTPISAPELTTTPSPVSPVSPPTSPASPDSSLASTVSSSSSFQARTPLSSDSTPLSTPTPPTSMKDNSVEEILLPLSTTFEAAPSSETLIPYYDLATVVVTIPDLVSDPSKIQATQTFQRKSSTTKTPAPPLFETSSAVTSKVQMPDLVSSPSQVPIKVPPVLQVSAPSPAPIVVSAQPLAQITPAPIATTTSASTSDLSSSISVVSCLEPVIVQMPDLVSTNAPIILQTPQPISALITTPAQAQAKVVHSVPVQSSVPLMRTVVVPAKVQPEQGTTSSPALTTVVKKKVPPPPPPRSTSVPLPDTTSEMPLIKTAMSSASAIAPIVTAQPMQSVVVDIQPRMDIAQSGSAPVPQVVTPTRQGHVVIIVPSMEKISLLEQTKQDGDDAEPNVASRAYGSQQTTNDTLCTDTSTVKVLSVPLLQPKPTHGAKVVSSWEVTHVTDPTSSPPPLLPKPLGSSVPTLVTSTIATVAPVSVTVSSPCHISKPPPPIPPKPISIPAGLVFTHKPGENIRPPPPPVAPKAATLPRMKEPPKALSLTLARPSESKLGTTSPKSPVSPRHAKCLQTYVVITLPSEPGSPTETITVQAPVRRRSIPSSTVSDLQTTVPEKKTPTEIISAQAAVRRASVPTIKHPPPIIKAVNVEAEQIETSEVVTGKVQTGEFFVPPAVQPIFSVADVITVSSDQKSCIMAHAVAPTIKKSYVSQQDSMTQPHLTSEPTSEVFPKPTEPKRYLILRDQSIVNEQSGPSVSQHPCAVTEVGTLFPTSLSEEPILQSTKPIATVQPGCLGEAVFVSEPFKPHVEIVVHGTPPTVHSINYDQHFLSQIDVQGIVHMEQDIDNCVTEGVLIRSAMQDESYEFAAEEPDTAIEVVVHSKDENIPGVFEDAFSLSELSSTPQTDQSSENMVVVTDQLFTHQLNIDAKESTLPAKFEYPAEVVTTDPGFRLPEVAVVSPVPHPLTVATKVSELMPLPTVAETVAIASIGSTLSHHMEGIQQVSTQRDISYTPQQSETSAATIMSYPVASIEEIPLQSRHERQTRFPPKHKDEMTCYMPSSEKHHALAEFPVITNDETTYRRRSSVSSIVQPPYTTSDSFTYPAEFEMPAQVVKAESLATARQESITMQQPQQFAQIITMPAEKDFPVVGYEAQVSYRRRSIPLSEQQPEALTYPCKYDHLLDTITQDAHTHISPVASVPEIPLSVSVAPVTITKIQQESIESQEIRGPEKVVSSMSHMYSSSISTSSQPPESLSSRVTQVFTTEVQRTTVSVVHERLQQVPPQSIAITIQPDIAKVQPLPKQNGKIIYPGDVIDLRTIKSGIKMTEQGMDLTPPESCRQSVSSDSSGRHITAVQPEIVNLSAELIPATTLSVVTDSITIVTCTATIASYNTTPAEKPLDLQGPVASLPLPLTASTYKPFEPLAQIVYRPVKAPPVFTEVVSMTQDIPMNLSIEALVSSGGKQSLTSAPTIISNVGPVVSLEAMGAMDLSNYKPMSAMVALSDTDQGVVTSIVEDDGVPMDLTAGRRSICCDVIYKLPFTRSCRTQAPVTTQPDNHSGFKDYAGLYSIKGTNGIKASLSETNLTSTGLSIYDLKSDYFSGSSDTAVDLTAAKLSAGEALNYTSKATDVYSAIITSPYSQVPAAGFGVNSALRTSDGIVYSSVAAPVPSTYAITTQPGSIFSTTFTPISTLQDQSLLHSYGFVPTEPGQLVPFEAELSKEFFPTALADIITGYPEMYSDTTLEAIAASLDALASSPIFPGLDNTKMAQYQMEREFLELEKLKQLCLAEELEWERQEIQRYREQEQLMVQRELEELQALKQQLLLQQEEEHHAHMVAQQETYAQQKEQLQQIQQLQLQLQRQLDEHYSSTGMTGNLLEAKYAGVGDSGQYWPVKDETTLPSTLAQTEQHHEQLNIVKLPADQDLGKKILDSGVQTDDEDSAEKQQMGRKKKTKRNIDSSAQSDDDDQDEWDAPTKVRRRSRKHSGDGKHGSKVSSIAIQTVAEISVQTDHSGTIKKPSVQMDTKIEIIKHISSPENFHRGGSLSCQTDTDRRNSPVEVGYSTKLTADVPSKAKVLYSQVSPLSPEKSYGGQRMLTADPTRFSSGPRSLKAGQKSLSDPKSLSPSTEDRIGGYYTEGYSVRGSSSSSGKKVKRTLPEPPPEDDTLAGRSGYSTNSARRRLARSTTMARAKILQDIDKELDLVERESSKLRKKQAELDEEEKEIDAKLRYLEMGINRRKEALLKEREKRERAYLQGVAEERDYMSDSEVGNIRETRGEGLERPRTAPQSEFDQFIPPQTEADSQYNTLTSPYSQYGQYVPQTQTTSHYTQQNLYQQQSLYHQQVSPYQTLSLSHAQAQPSSYQHALLLQQGKQHQTTLSELEPKITTNYEVIRNQPLLIVPSSTESGYGVAHMGGKYGNLDLRLEERSMASSPMSSISADSFYADIDHHNARNYVLIEDIGELTKASTGLGSSAMGSGFSLPDKELSKADRLLRAAEARRTAEVAEFLGSSRYGKGEDDSMEEPYELKLLKQQIKQEFRRGTEGLEHLTGLGLSQYLSSDSSFRHFPKGEKYSIGRLTLEKQAAKNLPAAMLYQKQMKNKKALLDSKAITKFSPIQESRDLEPEFGSFMGSGTSSVSSLAARARLLQDEITFGLRKNLSEQQKYLGSSLGANLSGSLNLGQSLSLGSTIRGNIQEDGTYPSGTRSRPSSRPSSIYGLDLSIKRDLSSSSLRLKTEGEVLDAAFAPGVSRAKPTSLPISQSRGRIPIVAQNSEEESPLSPVGQPMGMARASAGPLPPISADSRDQFGSSHSLPEVQQHMREESRTRGYDRDIAFIMDDLQGAMSDSEAYHLRREDTDWFDKPREGQPQSGYMSDRRQMKLVPYTFPHTRVKLKRDMTDTSVSGNGLGVRVVGGKEIPGSRGEIGTYIAKVIPGGMAEQTGKIVEGMQVLEWNGVPLTGKTYEEVQCIMGKAGAEAELCVRLDLNMLSDPEHPQALDHHIQLKAGGQRSPGVDPKQLAAELQKVSQQQTPDIAGTGPGGFGVLSALERSALLHSGPGSAASSGVPSPGQPGSPAINKKQRHKPTEVMKAPHPITGEIQLQINYDRNLGNLIVHVLQARNLAPRDNDGYSDPFVKVYLLPGRGQVMVVQNASADNKRRTKYALKTTNPEWNQTVIYKNIHLEQLKKKTLEVTVWDYDRSSSNDFLGEVLIDLSNTAQLDNTPRWLPLKEQSESIEQSRSHQASQAPPGSGSGQGHGQGHFTGQGHMSGSGQVHGMGQSQGPGQGDLSHDSPKNSVIKSRSHGIFPDPAKDMQMLPLEKSHSSPGSSKSSSDGQLRSHGPSRSQSKSSVTQAHLEDAGIAIAAAEAAVQQSRLQPRPGHRLGDVSGSVVLSAPSLVGDAYGGLDGDEGVGIGVDSAIFQVPRIGKTIPNGTDKNQQITPENEGGKTQVIGEIKVALKKEVKTEGDQLVLEILQCRNITYKFKSPDHLPDLYVKLYVVNVATQKRIIKKKTRVCRHDREPSFNETFRFPLNPTGHSIQLFLVSNGGKFVKKTLIGEAYIWLDKVDMRKRVVSWHKLFVSSNLTNP